MTLRLSLSSAGIAVAFMTLGGCASSLRSDLRDHPHGRFADGAAVSRASSAPLEPAQDTAPDADLQPADDLVAPPHTAPIRGPIAAAELALIGVPTSDDGALNALRGDWHPSRTLDYSTALAAYLARSPAIAEAVANYRASFERRGQIRALDDLLRQYDAFGVGLKTNASTPMLRPLAGKSYPLGGVLDLEGRLATVDVQLARAMFEDAILKALSRFEMAWQGAVYQQQATRILGRVTELAGRAVDAARGRYSAGGSSHANLIQAEIRETDVKNQYANARAKSISTRLALAAELDLPPLSLERHALHLDERLPGRPQRVATRTKAMEQSPEVAMARSKLDRASLLVLLTKRQITPNFAEGKDIPGSGPRPAAADLPYATAAPFLRELELRESASVDALRLAERRAVANADRVWAMLDDALRRRGTASTQLSRADQAVEVAERGYGAGTASYLDLDNAIKLYLAMALDARAALRDAFVAAAELTVATGTGANPRARAEEDMLNKDDHD